jgi:hypothetical protein
MRKDSIRGRTSRGDCGGQGVITGIGEKPRRQAENNITFLLLLRVEPLVPDLLHKLLATSKQGAEVDELLLLLIGRLSVEFGTPSPGVPPIGVLELLRLRLAFWNSACSYFSGPSCSSWSLSKSRGKPAVRPWLVY